jgi:NAD(P)-dependent dehydrogenase (short-subunit alcohol dehydrogenase family)
MNDDRVVLVTAASRGIGYATAQAFLAEGASVVITARKEDVLREAAEALGGTDRVLAVAGNAGDASHRRAAVAAAIERFGRLDVLVNNAGINPVAGDLADMDLGALTKILDVNLVGSLGWVQEAVAQWMAEHGGCVVNVSSVSGVEPMPLIGGYGTSKAALIHLTRQLARELGPAGIRVNAVAPAVVRTRFGSPLFEGHEEETASAYPLGRIGEPQDVAHAIAFLASGRSSWISGQTLVLDGGLLTNSHREI